MRYIQTLYFQNKKNPFIDSFGWIKPEYHIMGWALSCLQLNKLYGQVELYANSAAAQLLINTLELPYSKLHLEHNNLQLVNENLWALPKLYTYSLQNEEFLHIDGDVFIFNNFPDSLFENQLIAQNIELATEYYLSTQKELMENLKFFPRTVKNDFESAVPIKAVNAGILGGSNMSFFKEYTNNAFEYINKNIPNLSLINVDRFNVFFEQHLFYCLSKEKSIPISLLFQEVTNDNEYKFLGNFHERFCGRDYFHLLGHLKRDEFTCLQMANVLRDLYPECYYKIISLCKKNNIVLTNDLYYKNRFHRLEDWGNLHNESLECYRRNEIYLKNKPTDCSYNLSELLNVYNTYTNSVGSIIDLQKLENDFDAFVCDLTNVLSENEQISDDFLHGRDLDSGKWFADIFRDNSTVLDKIIIQSDVLSVIVSEFDWAGLYNKYRRSGINYYLSFSLKEGLYYNLVIPEISEGGYSLIDIDELEKIILDHLIQPISIRELLSEMQSYVEIEVVRTHLDEFNSLIIEIIKQLIVIKAIKPFNSFIE